MGKAARLKRERAQGQRRGRPLSLVFCDVDFERGSRAHGRGVAAAPPEGWVIGRADLVHARWDGEQLQVATSSSPDPGRPAPWSKPWGALTLLSVTETAAQWGLPIGAA